VLSERTKMNVSECIQGIISGMNNGVNYNREGQNGVL
jgi:hypothetical protein